MNIRKFLVTLLFIVLLAALSGCAPKASEEAAAPAGAAGAVKLIGLVNAEQSLTAEQLKGMETKQVNSTNKDGKTTTYTGVGLTKLLESAGVKSEAKALLFTGSDGYSSEVSLTDIQACTDCILAFQDDGTFINIMPGLAGNTQVRGLVEIKVK